MRVAEPQVPKNLPHFAPTLDPSEFAYKPHHLNELFTNTFQNLHTLADVYHQHLTSQTNNKVKAGSGQSPFEILKDECYYMILRELEGFLVQGIDLIFHKLKLSDMKLLYK